MRKDIAFREAVEPMARKYRWAGRLGCNATANPEMCLNTAQVLDIMAEALDISNQTISDLQRINARMRKDVWWFALHGFLLGVAFGAVIAVTA